MSCSMNRRRRRSLGRADSLAAALQRSVDKGRISERDAADIADRIVYTRELADLAGADAVIEAITEDASIKRDLFARLDEQLPGATFLASNTSSIPIAEL